jgi:hypothetical protein
VFEIWEQRKIFGPAWEEVTEDNRKLHIGLLYYLTSLLYVTLLLKNRKEGCGERHVAHFWGEEKCVQSFDEEF